jgi:alanine-glyoxylate transaminase/(R)-3-amino-2-methylpropionate-pyruvate transaminase
MICVSTRNYDLMCLRNAYHGMSMTTMGTCTCDLKQNVPRTLASTTRFNSRRVQAVLGNDGPAYAEDVR